MKILRWLLPVVAVLLGAYAAAWIGGLVGSITGPHASFDDLTQSSAWGFLIAAAILCPLLGWAGWRIGNRKR
ncbi:hypothetical protein [Caldimonas brevitalea]|uniref:Uncharacterized protein n=1 Tax=Caldimonas brevitalea TaxID=413882 RepID=A0A0G3BTK6_9BURK|nr:hypothetical protein [Caldimonas brevitalea]AKJ29835.1 hypothetical protein AAW51_3144 [Caldimonas brevitalea]